MDKLRYKIEFSIRDYDKTYDKWINYKSKKYNKLVNDIWGKDQISIHLKSLSDSVVYLVLKEYSARNIIADIKELKQAGKPYKRLLNNLKTIVNYATRTSNA